MLAMLRDHHLWLGVEFTIASHGGGALDLLGRDGSPTPLYDAFAAVSVIASLRQLQTTDPGFTVRGRLYAYIYFPSAATHEGPSRASRAHVRRPTSHVPRPTTKRRPS